MLIYYHPADTDYAKNYAIWNKLIIPTGLSFSHASKDYFVTKDEGSGIVLDSEWHTFGNAQTAWINICNNPDADDYLGGSGRAHVIAINIKTHTITNGLVVAR